MKRSRFLLSVLAPASLAVVLAGCTGLEGSVPVAAGRLTALVTGTVWANLEPCG